MLFIKDLSYALNDGRVLFDGLDMKILKGERIAIVGENGVGKSTLLKTICGEIQPDRGDIKQEKQTKIAWLRQEPVLDLSLDVRTTLECADPRVQRLQATLNSVDASDADKQHALEALEDLGALDRAYKIERVMSELGLTPFENRTLETLSGGQRRRVDLARVLESNADLVILDEPTNHLDFDGIDFLKNEMRDKTLLFISHDRYFVDNVATRILELDRGRAFSFDAPMANYLEEKLTREALEVRTLDRKKRILAREMVWLRRSPQARTTKSKSRVDRAHELIDNVREQVEHTRERVLSIRSGQHRRLAKTILECDELGVGYPDFACAHGLTLKLLEGERWGILGPNGAGKSTLLKTLLGDLEPLEGKVKMGLHTRIGLIDQHRMSLDDEKSLGEYLAPEGDWVFLGEERLHVCTYLEQYLFKGSERNRKVGMLSGGERSRLTLAKMMLEEANCIVLDEPTNDLDVTTQNVLEDVLSKHRGVALIVSHDRHFLNRVCTGMIGFVDAPENSDFKYELHAIQGDFDRYLDYRKTLEAERAQSRIAAKSQSALSPHDANAKIDSVQINTQSKKSNAKKKKRSYKEEREFESMEERILEHESQKEELERLLADPEFMARGGADILVKVRELEDLTQTIASLYTRWDELEAMGG